MKTHAKRVTTVLFLATLSLGISPIATARGRDEFSPIERFLQKFQRFVRIVVTDNGWTPPTP